MWIAFKNYYLRDTTQLGFEIDQEYYGCELLSKIIIFVTRHNRFHLIQRGAVVVNCFQKLLSSWHDTTKPIPMISEILLWIAFKNYYLRDTTQRDEKTLPKVLGCELLSKIIIFVTRHNNAWRTYHIRRVVNCFQKLLSSWHDTTRRLIFNFLSVLWIAFKNYYLRDTTQRLWWKLTPKASCELLSKIIIFVTRHNKTSQPSVSCLVVNCFQKLLSSWHDTTSTNNPLKISGFRGWLEL